MLAVKLEDSPIDITISFIDKGKGESFRDLIIRLLSDLREEIKGEDQISGTNYDCTRSQDFRLLKIKASRRPAWTSIWNAEVQVISSDVLQPDDDKVHLVCHYLFGPKRDVSGQLMDAYNAADQIRNRIRIGLDNLAKDAEKYKGRIQISV